MVRRLFWLGLTLQLILPGLAIADLWNPDLKKIMEEIGNPLREMKSISFALIANRNEADLSLEIWEEGKATISLSYRVETLLQIAKAIECPKDYNRVAKIIMSELHSIQTDIDGILIGISVTTSLSKNRAVKEVSKRLGSKILKLKEYIRELEPENLPFNASPKWP